MTNQNNDVSIIDCEINNDNNDIISIDDEIDRILGLTNEEKRDDDVVSITDDDINEMFGGTDNQLISTTNEVCVGRRMVSLSNISSYQSTSFKDNGKSAFEFPTNLILKSHRKRYEHWTENEHRLFLIGLQNCRPGDWKSISKNYIPSKTSTQIASHAQKYRLHQNGLKKNKKRKSIHDVSLHDINDIKILGLTDEGKKEDDVISITDDDINEMFSLTGDGLISTNNEVCVGASTVSYQSTSFKDNGEFAHELLTPSVLNSHRKRYERWTENEHRLFLIGLKSCSPGDWKSISKYYIPSKTSTQIASHAQKYRLHQNSLKENKKRKSIHDITLDDINTSVVPSFINEEQWLCPTPNFSIQPQEMQGLQHINL